MKNNFTFLVFAIIVLLSSCNERNISGEWEWQTNDATADFTLYLEQQDNGIIGSYCGIFNNGTRIDCPMDNEKNVSGKLNNDGIWRIQYVSSYSGKKGNALIEYISGEDMLLWHNLSPESGAFCPDKGQLVRVGNN